MLKDITLGQYFPGNSIAHKLDPRTKILLVTLYIIALFSAKGWMGYAVMAVTLAACVKVSHVGLRALVRGLKPLVFIIAFTGILNMFFTPDTHYLWEWGILRVSVKGIENALFMVIRIMLLVMGTFLMTYTTSPIRLTDGLESLLNPLKKIRVPVHELAMMMAIALRFIPTLIEETDKIMSAQKARGADFDSGNIFQKAKALVPILVPLFISAFRRADELATAMECRCYHGGEGRTKLHVLKYQRRDYVALAGGVVDQLPDDAPQFVADYYAYYKTPRGYHPRSLGSNGGWNVTSSLSFLNMPILRTPARFDLPCCWCTARRRTPAISAKPRTAS